MPVGTKLNNVWLEASTTGSTLMHVTNALMYGMSGIVVNVHDPDTQITYDSVWDEQVNKDQADTYASGGGTFLDTETADTAPEFEVGEIDLEALMGVELEDNTEIFRRRKMVTFPGNPIGFDGTNQFWPADHFKVHIKGGPKVTAPSVAMFGFSSPAMDQTEAGSQYLPSSTVWMIYQFIDSFLEDMFKHLIGISGGSNIDPYQDASVAIAKLLEDKMIEPDGNYLPGNAWGCITKVTWDITIDGFNGISTISSE